MWPVAPAISSKKLGILSVVAAQALWDASVADPWLSLNVLLACLGFELFAQLSYEHAEIFGLMRGLCSPDAGQERSMGNDPPGVSREMNQQLKFLRREVQWFSNDLDAVRHGVNDEVTRADYRFGSLRRAPQMRTHSGEEFLDAERLCDVIVGAGIERLNLRTLVIANRQDQDRRERRGTNGPADFNPAQSGHHEVGDDEVRLPLGEEP
jgi:hypothetical protein